MTPPEQLFGGEGPPLLLLHSGTLTFREWRVPFSLLSCSHTVLAPTLPGSRGGPPLELGGRRSVVAAICDSLEDQLDSLRWSEPIPIAGSSLGGVIALELAARGRASAVVALAPPWVGGKSAVFYWAVFASAGAAVRLGDPLLPRLAAVPAYGGLMLHGSLRPCRMDADDVVETMRSFASFPLLRIAREWRCWPVAMLPDFSLIRCPVVLVWGTRDMAAPLRTTAPQWQRSLPAARLVTLPGFPHVPHLRDPERIADLIAEASERPALETKQGAAA